MRHLPQKLRSALASPGSFRQLGSTAGRRQGGWHLVPTLESLESRQLLTAWPDTIDEYATQGVVVDAPFALTPIVGGVCGRDGVFEDTDPSPVPAASPFDFNLDGHFNSADWVAAYQAKITVVPSPGTTTQLGQDAHRFVFESSDLIETLQFQTYESLSQLSGESCDVGRGDQRLEYEYSYPDGQNVRETVAYVFKGELLRSRSARQVDPQGNTRSITVDTYTEDSESLVSRSEMHYDDRGRLTSELILFYDTEGNVRRSSTTLYDYDQGPVFRLTNVYNFDEHGRLVLQRIHRFDINLKQLGLDIIKYEVGAPWQGQNSLPASSEGANQQQLGSPELLEAGALPGLTDLGYLAQVRAAYLTARQRLEPQYREILRMNELQVQANLAALLSSSQLSPTEIARFRNLDVYFRLVKDLVSVQQNDEPRVLQQRYAGVVDATTGAWQPWFLDFAREEGLALPLPPLRVAFPPTDLAADEIAQLAARYRQVVGPNPMQYFQELRRAGTEQVSRVLESMRRVKVQLKLLQIELQGQAPAYEWLIARDKPDLASFGLQPVQLLASWYFFESDERNHYFLDQPSDAVIQKRVSENLTDEELFYAINIEHWELEGDLDVVQANLQKLRQVADLVHSYNPNLLVGFYRLLPRRDPSAAYVGPGTAQHDAWQAHNDRVAASLEDAVDVFFPSLYVLHLGDQNQTTAERWTTFAMGNIEEAVRIADGKPVLPFLSLYYHPNGSRDDYPALPRNLKGWQWVEPELLLYQMMKLDELADGFVLFNDRPTSWSNLVGTGLSESIQRFQSAGRDGRRGQLQAHYDRLFTQYHDELLAREATERLLAEKLQSFSRVRNSNPRLANLLSREINQLQAQLDDMIQIWNLLAAYWAS